MSLAAFGAAATAGSAEAGFAGAAAGRVTRSGAGLDDGAGAAFITGAGRCGAGAKAGASARGAGRSVGEADARVSGGTTCAGRSGPRKLPLSSADADGFGMLPGVL